MLLGVQASSPSEKEERASGLQSSLYRPCAHDNASRSLLLRHKLLLLLLLLWTMLIGRLLHGRARSSVLFKRRALNVTDAGLTKCIFINNQTTHAVGPVINTCMRKSQEQRREFKARIQPPFNSPRIKFCAARHSKRHGAPALLQSEFVNARERWYS